MDVLTDWLPRIADLQAEADRNPALLARYAADAVERQEKATDDRQAARTVTFDAFVVEPRSRGRFEDALQAERRRRSRDELRVRYERFDGIDRLRIGLEERRDSAHSGTRSCLGLQWTDEGRRFRLWEGLPAGAPPPRHVATVAARFQAACPGLAGAAAPEPVQDQGGTGPGIRRVATWVRADAALVLAEADLRAPHPADIECGQDLAPWYRVRRVGDRFQVHVVVRRADPAGEIGHRPRFAKVVAESGRGPVYASFDRLFGEEARLSGYGWDRWEAVELEFPADRRADFTAIHLLAPSVGPLPPTDLRIPWGETRDGALCPLWRGAETPPVAFEAFAPRIIAAWFADGHLLLLADRPAPRTLDSADVRLSLATGASEVAEVQAAPRTSRPGADCLEEMRIAGGILYEIPLANPPPCVRWASPGTPDAPATPVDGFTGRLAGNFVALPAKRTVTLTGTAPRGLPPIRTFALGRTARVTRAGEDGRLDLTLTLDEFLATDLSFGTSPRDRVRPRFARTPDPELVPARFHGATGYGPRDRRAVPILAGIRTAVTLALNWPFPPTLPPSYNVPWLPGAGDCVTFHPDPVDRIVNRGPRPVWVNATEVAPGTALALKPRAQIRLSRLVLEWSREGIAWVGFLGEESLGTEIRATAWVRVGHGDLAIPLLPGDETRFDRFDTDVRILPHHLELE